MVKWSLLIPNKRKEGHTLEWSKLRFVVRVCSHDFTQCHCTQLLLELLLENVPKKIFFSGSSGQPRQSHGLQPVPYGRNMWKIQYRNKRKYALLFKIF